jgi:hypothetical protein
MVFCPGCGKSLSLAGYRNHLQHTANPSCYRIYQESLEQFSDVDSDEDLDIDEDLPEVDMPGLPVIKDDIGGDLDNPAFYDDINDIGDVANDPMDVEYSEKEQDEEVHPEEEDETDEEEFDYNYEDHWELPPESSEMDIDFQNEPESEDDLVLLSEKRLLAEDVFCQAPIVEKFPSPYAGAPIPNTKTLSKDEAYQKDINAPHNPWAPFSSKMDWEIAKWAKLRGPGSTALSDLLKINGVRCYSIDLILTSNYYYEGL